MNFIEGDSGLAGLSLVAAAHELKAPLVLLRQLSFQMLESSDLRANREVSQRMQLVSERSLRLVDGLTKVARLEDAMFQTEPIQLRGLCAEVLNEISPLAYTLNRKISLKISRKVPAVVANKDLLHGLLVNLLDNSLQYSNDNDNEIELSARISRSRAQISVKDSGKLDLKEFRQLRKKLGKQAQPVSDQPLSSGLGLFIAGEFARAMDGELTVSRHKKGGLTFSANLPISHQLSLFGEN